MTQVDCALCGSNEHILILKSSDHRFRLGSELFDLVKCSSCNLIFINPQPSLETLNDFYPDNGYYAEKNRLFNTYSAIIRNLKVRKLEKCISKGVVLDIGCGDGALLEALKARGWKCYGTDVSRQAYGIAKKKLENIYLGQLKEAKFEAEKFDLIMFNHSFEHLLDPNAELEECRRILKPGGLIYLSVPNINTKQYDVTGEFWHHLEIPRHIYHYTSATLQKLLQKHGYQPILVSFPMFDFPFDVLHSLRVKWKNEGFKVKEAFYALPLLKVFPRWRSALDIIARR